MILGIDAINIVETGGVTHIQELLKETNPQKYGFKKVVIWANKKVTNSLPKKHWLIKRNKIIFENNFVARFFWKNFFFDRQIAKEKCNILFVLSGTYNGSFKPVVTISQNLLPFSKNERNNYGFFRRLKIMIQRFVQKNTFIKNKSVIFLTKSSKKIIEQNIGIKIKNSKIIPHGINKKFQTKPKIQKTIYSYSFQRPFEILYVSKIEMYKNQINVVKAISILRNNGFPVKLTMVGPNYPVALEKLNEAIDNLDPKRSYIKYLGEYPYKKMEKVYKKANLNLFASSCETFGQSLLESMAAGLPNVCSNYSVFKELLGNSAVYFNPKNSKNIADSIKILLLSKSLRSRISKRSFELAKKYSWKKCADQTFILLSNNLN